MPNILIIDQDAHIRRLVRRVLESAGYRVAEASTLMEVLEQLMECLPDVILLDCLLGGYGLGLDLLREIRKTPRTREIPVVVTTGLPHPDVEIYLRNCGATAYLLKPFSPRDLLRALEVAVKAPRPELEHAAAS
jgi:two-component system, OmpR family, phosphate regulon response regulator PhoB